MKTSLAFLAGAGIGALAMWLALPVGRNRAAAEISPVASRDAQAQAQARGSSTPSAEERRAAKTDRPAKPLDDDGGAKVLDEDEMDSPEMRQIRDAMAKQLEGRRSRRLDERVATLKTRLNLDEQQVAKIRAILEKGEAEDDFVGKMIAGEGGAALPDAADAAAKRGATEAEIANLLTPEQSEAFGNFQKEQRENRIEVATSREMTRLQQALTLTPEQKDKAFEALGQIAAREEQEHGNGPSFDPAVIKARKEARLEVLRPILTPQQLESYQADPGWGIDVGGADGISISHDTFILEGMPEE